MSDKVRERIESLDREVLVNFMDQIVEILYFEVADDKAKTGTWNRDKEWDSAADYIEFVAETIPERVYDLIKYLTPNEEDDG